MHASRALFVPFALLLGLTACTGDETDSPADTTTSDATWQLTCGAPVCQGHSDHGVDACTTETEGASCETTGATCDPTNDCNADLQCAVANPAVDCPRSLRSTKTDIRYLAPEEVATVARDLGAVRLATWRYNEEPVGSKPHLGFVIDDLPAGSPAVRADGGHVDLYGWATMNAAAVQDQQRQIDALKAELAALRAELKAR